MKAKYPNNTILSHRPSGRRGMTLVELLVVVSIILLVMAVSVPALKPVMETKQTSDGADTVSLYLNSARMRAISTQRPCGVLFERLSESTDCALVLRQVEVPPYYGGSSANVRVSVEANGTLGFYVPNPSYDPTYGDPSDNPPPMQWYPWAEDTSEKLYWQKMIGQQEARIQFNNQGPYYRLLEDNGIYYISFRRHTFSDNGTPNDPDDDIYEEYPRVSYYTDTAYDSTESPASFKIIRGAKPTLTKPVGLPRGTVVDLNYSGYGMNIDNGINDPLDDFSKNSDSDVIVIFAPNGEVQSINGVAPQGPVYFCIGRWDRAGDPAFIDLDINDAAPEYNRNYADMTNFWVTLNPKSGNVSIAPVANPIPSGSSPTTAQRLNNSRTLAKQQQFGQ